MKKKICKNNFFSCNKKNNIFLINKINIGNLN